MSNVVSLAAFEHVVVDTGTVTSSTTPADVGKHMFFVAYHDGDGGVLHDYAGSSHADAMASARGWGVPVYDRTKDPS
jgi:hypothetical protein